MSRFIRLYEKKRGDRRTGSRAFGSFGEALFFGLFFLVGCVGLGAMFGMFVWPEWRANRQFAPATCVVLGKEVVEQPAAENQPAAYRPEITIRYHVDDREYEATTYDVTGMFMENEHRAREIVDGFTVGGEYPCWYDPINPHTAVLVRGYSGWLYVLLLVPLSFMVIGGGILVYTLLHWNASAERRSLMNQQAAQLDLFEEGRKVRNYPTVPADANLTNSPGTSLAYRLPIAPTTGWMLFAITTACVLWNGIVLLFLIMAVRSFVRADPDWILAVFVIPFAVIGGLLVGYLVRQIMIVTRVGPTRVEISHHPLAPGQNYDLFLSQAGRLSIQSLGVWLACDEKVTFRQGTDTRTESRRVFENQFFAREDFEVQQDRPFESRCQISVPASAMHSFQSDHNEVSWKLIVRGSVANWPDYERVFQIIVNPTNGKTP